MLIVDGAFLPPNGRMLWSLDGEFARNTARLLARLPDLVWGLPMAPFEEMGTLFQFNPLLTPSLWPLGVFDETVGVSVGYVICAG